MVGLGLKKKNALVFLSTNMFYVHQTVIDYIKKSHGHELSLSQPTAKSQQDSQDDQD